MTTSGRGAAVVLMTLVASVVPTGSAAQTPDSVAIPDVRRMVLPRAADLLARAGIRVVVVDSVPWPADAGDVLFQAPLPGEVRPAPVAETLWVARLVRPEDANFAPMVETLVRAGDEATLLTRLRRMLAERPPVRLTPSVIGLPVEEAEVAFAMAGIQVADLPKVETSEPEGIVVRQLPPAWTPFDEGGVVGSLWVSAGQSVPDVQPPDVDPSDVDPAGPVDSAAADPGGAGQGGPGEAVDTVGPDEPPVSAVRVPDLIGLESPDARRVLRSLGLSTPEPESVAAQGGVVVDQDPEPGTLVGPGSAVFLTAEPVEPAEPAGQVDTADTDEVVDVWWSNPLGWLAAGALLLILLPAPRRWLVGVGGAALGLGRTPRSPRNRPTDRSPDRTTTGHSVRYRPRPSPPEPALRWTEPRLWKLEVDFVPRPGTARFGLRMDGHPRGGTDDE